MDPKRILCPVDFSECSRLALNEASARAARYGAKLFIVHVDEFGQAYPPGHSGYSPQLDEHRRLLKEAQPTSQEIDYELHYLRGNVMDEIRRFAALREVDLIVMGTHGRTGLARVLKGSVAECVTKHAPCPVVTVCSSEREIPAEPPGR